MDESDNCSRLEPLGTTCTSTIASPPDRQESRSMLVIEGEAGASPTQQYGTNDDDQSLKDMFLEAKVEMLSIVEAELKMKLEVRDIKRQFLDLLLTYSDMQCISAFENDSLDFTDDLPRPDIPESDQDDPSPNEQNHLEDTLCHDSSTVVYTTDACNHDSSTVEETPTNRRMPREKYLLLNEDGSRASSNYSSPPTWVRGIQPISTEPRLTSRRRSLMMAYDIRMSDSPPQRDENALLSRGLTYGGDSVASIATSANSLFTDSLDFSIEATKDEGVNRSEISNISSDGLMSFDMNNSSLPGYSISHAHDESSYKESDAVWSPEGNSFSTSVCARRMDDKSFEMNSQRKENNKMILLNKLNRQISGATCSSMNSEARIPDAPMNSPNSTAVSNDFLINNTMSSSCHIPSVSQCFESPSFPNIGQDDDVFYEPDVMVNIQELEHPERHPQNNGESEPPKKMNLLELPKAPWQKEAKDPGLPDIDEFDLKDSEVDSPNLDSRPPCIGGEEPEKLSSNIPINLPPKTDTKQSKISSKLSRTPLGKTLSAVKRAGSFSFRRSFKSGDQQSKDTHSLASFTSGSSTASGSLDSVPESQVEKQQQITASVTDDGGATNTSADSDNVNNNQVKETSQKTGRKSKNVFQRIQSLRKHFKTGQKNKQDKSPGK